MFITIISILPLPLTVVVLQCQCIESWCVFSFYFSAMSNFLKQFPFTARRLAIARWLSNRNF